MERLLSLKRRAPSIWLKQNIEKVIEIWESRVRSQISDDQQIHPDILRDELPSFLTKLADHLLSGPQEIRATSFSAIAQKHGQERATLSEYSLTRVMFEYHVLRETL